MPPKTMKAIRVVSQGKAEIKEVPVPELRDGEILVKVGHIAINPIDWMGRDWMPIIGSLLGGDFSGTVEEVGPNVKKSWAVGDRVSGWVVGNNKVRPDNGGFAEYVAADAEVSMHVPEGVSDAEAASPPAGAGTSGTGIFELQGLPLPGEGDGKGETILIYGGTSATSTIGIQLAKLAGYDVITTCGARSFDHVKSLGASAAFDYHDKDCGEKIREHTKDKLKHVFDTIAKDESPKICAAAMSSQGGTIAHTLPYPEDFERKDIKLEMVFVLGIFGKDFGYGEQVIPANPAYYDFGKRLYSTVEKLWHDGKIKVHPPKVSETGLEGVLGGVDDVKSGKAGGVKLIYKM